MSELQSKRLRREAQAFRFYGASAEAQECEDLAKQFETLEDEVARLRFELERAGRESLMRKGMET